MPLYKSLLILFTTTSLFSFEESFVYNDNVKIVYRDYGPSSADPILLVHELKVLDQQN